jgi:hypothetical protein
MVGAMFDNAPEKHYNGEEICELGALMWEWR